MERKSFQLRERVYFYNNIGIVSLNWIERLRHTDRRFEIHLNETMKLTSRIHIIECEREREKKWENDKRSQFCM